MKTIRVEKIPRIIKSKRKLEQVLNIKITNRGREITITGSAENEYIAEKVIDAINLGFSVPTALLIKKEDYLFEIINIKDHTKRVDLSRIKARIIGTSGTTLKTLNQLTNCFFELKGYDIGIIGSAENIGNAQEAIISIIKGSKQGNVYGFLEKHKVQPVIDLGLKDKE